VIKMINIVHKILNKVLHYGKPLKFEEEKHVSNSAYKVFYIIRRNPPGAGFFSNYFYVLSHIIYSLQNNWIPVIDMMNYGTLYSEKDPINTTCNAWEYYFNQPTQFSIDDAYSSNNYILSSGNYFNEMGVPVFSINKGHITSQMVTNLTPVIEKYITIKMEILQEVQKFVSDLFITDRIVGVHIRGTDMNKKKAEHTLPPQWNRVMEAVDNYLRKNSHAKIFLCTDEEIAIEEFRQIYGEKLIYKQAFRSKNSEDSNQGIHFQKNERKYHSFNMGREVLADALILSQCSSLICGISNVSSAAILFNKGIYEEIMIL